MAQPASLPISVIGPEFVAPSQLELIVETHEPGNLLIAEIDHKILRIVPFIRKNLQFQEAIAQIHKFQRLKNAKLTKGKYMGRDNPNVDYAFVVALIAILYGMNNADKKTSRSGAVGGVLDALGNLDLS
ncbi:LURP-one-related 10-like protein [Tanacetum coccineum]